MYKEQLKYFALVYQLQSYSAAAKQIPMSPQGLTKSIHSLETELGIPLFSAGENGKLEPTAYAEELLQFAHYYDANYNILMESIRRIQENERDQIRVGISLGILGYLGSGFIARFKEQNPEVELYYDELTDRVCDNGLREGRYSMALTIAPYDDEFLSEELYSTPLFFWVAANSDLAKKDSLCIEDFDTVDLALPGPDFKCYSTLSKACADAGVRFNNVYSSAEIFRLYEFAHKGRGLGFSAEHLIKMPLFNQDASVVALPLEGFDWRFGISKLPTRNLSTSEQSFYDYCIKNI